MQQAIARAAIAEAGGQPFLLQLTAGEPAKTNGD
jgi:hypothetical protein